MYFNVDGWDERGMSPKKGDELREFLKHLKMWNDFLCQYRPICDNDPTICIHYPKKNLDNVGFQQEEATTHTSRIFMGALR
ncbi:hypothetical protein TNCV_2200871 [Trichonephila clavipes]|nr:hypothetical protein TNCV_2200871 [Trichonephila clavipes]